MNKKIIPVQTTKRDKTKIKVVVFDIGGVLLEILEVKSFWKNSPETSQELREKFGAGKITTKQFISEGAKLLNISQSIFLKGYKKAYFSAKPKNDVLEIFKKLSLDKYLLSDTNPLVSKNHLLKLKDINKEVKGCFLSHKIKMRKTDIQTFDFLIKKVGVNPEEILFIDDSIGHLERAKTRKINTLLFEDSFQLLKDLKKLHLM